MLERLAPEQWDTLPDIAEPRENRAFFGHGDIVARLASGIDSGKLHHGQLFAGPRGVGKATLAFRLAASLISGPGRSPDLAPPPPDSAPWRQIASGAHPGILHLARPWDEKRKLFRTALTVEEVRRVARFVGTTQHDGGWRAVIVDSADDMNAQAANALLKNLEEPPARTVFIVISHSPGRLLPTIRSRCQLVRFAPLDDDDLFSAMKASGAPIAPAELPLLAARAGGSVREALLLALNGGLELASAADAILAGARFDVAATAKLADAVAGREESIQFDLLNRHLLDRVAAAARAAAETGRAAAFAALWQSAREAVDLADAFNLDKKQHIAGLLRRLHEAGA